MIVKNSQFTPEVATENPDTKLSKQLQSLALAFIQEHGFGHGISFDLAVRKAYEKICDKLQGAPDAACDPEEFAAFCRQKGIMIAQNESSHAESDTTQHPVSGIVLQSPIHDHSHTSRTDVTAIFEQVQ